MSHKTVSPIEFARIRMDGCELVLYLSAYARSHVPAVFATSMENGRAYPYGNLSVNLSSQGLILAPWHISVKTWAENEDLARACQDSEAFERTGQNWRVPFGTAQVWRLVAERMPALAVLQMSRLMRWPLDAGLLVELAARSPGADAGPVEIELDGLRLRAHLRGESGDLFFESDSGADLPMSDQARLDDAIAAGCFNLFVPTQGQIYHGLGPQRMPALIQSARLESAVQALASARALDASRTPVDTESALRPRRSA